MSERREEQGGLPGDQKEFTETKLSEKMHELVGKVGGDPTQPLKEFLEEETLHFEPKLSSDEKKEDPESPEDVAENLQEKIDKDPFFLLIVLKTRLSTISTDRQYVKEAIAALDTLHTRLQHNNNVVVNEKGEEDYNDNNAANINDNTKQLNVNMLALFENNIELAEEKNEAKLKARCQAICFLGEYYGTEYDEFFLHHAAQFASGERTFEVLYNLDVFQQFLSFDVDLDLDGENKTLLHRAAMNFDTGPLQYLFEQYGAIAEPDVLKKYFGETRDAEGFSVLDYAAQNSLGHVNIARESGALLYVAKSAAEVFLQTNHDPLYYAAGTCPEVVRDFLDKNKDNKGALNNEMRPYLTNAMEHGQVEIVDMLLGFDKKNAPHQAIVHGNTLADVIDLNALKNRKPSLADKFTLSDDTSPEQAELAMKLIANLHAVLENEKQYVDKAKNPTQKHTVAQVKKNVRVQKAVLALHRLHDNLDTLEAAVKNGDIDEEAARQKAALHMACFLENSRDFTSATQKAVKVLGAVLIGLTIGLLAGVIIAAAATGNVTGLGGAFAAAQWGHHILLGGIAGAVFGGVVAGGFAGNKLFESNRAVNKFHDLMESTYVDDVLMPMAPKMLMV